MQIGELEKIASEIRLLMLEALRPKESHHIGCAFSIADILTYLYFNELNVNPKNPKDPKRDIFLLSKGHAALALYATLCQKGFFPKARLLTYDQDGSDIPEHASIHAEGVELSTGSLGHALPVGIGFATSFLNDKKKNKVYVLLSDGELDEGSNWEAIMYAGHHKIKNLTAIVDKNGFQGYADTEKVLDLSPLKKKIEAFGWEVIEADGHNFESLKTVFDQRQSLSKPKMIIASTVKGKGIPYFEGRFDSHYKSINEETKNKIINEFIKL
ncbi:MAG: transketolase [Patescibacteria group bacterium]